MMSPTIADLIAEIQHALTGVSDTPLLDAQVLMAHCLHKPRSWVLAHPEVTLTVPQEDEARADLQQLLRGMPLPYLLGTWEFYGLDFIVTPSVLIPRPETELLVQHCLDWLQHNPDRLNAIDVGTGSGCIAIALAHNLPGLHVLLTDLSQDALSVARQNAGRHGLMDRIKFQQADLLDGLCETFDLLCANLPYIPTQVVQGLKVAKFEPIQALDGGDDGLALITRLLHQSRDQLDRGGLMALEIGAEQAAAVKALAEGLYPNARIRVLKDLAGLDRCLSVERSQLVLHLCPQRDWLAARGSGSYTTASLTEQGFIHCSLPGQILGVANRFYGAVSDLVLLWIDPEKLSSPLRWESSDGDTFPHMYGPVDLPAVLSVSRLVPDTDGVFRCLPAMNNNKQAE